MFGYKKEDDKEEMLRKMMESAGMVDPALIEGMKANTGDMMNLGPTAPSLALPTDAAQLLDPNMAPNTGAMDNTAAIGQAMAQGNPATDAAFGQAMQNAQQPGMADRIGNAMQGMSHQYQPPGMLPLQRGGGMMPLPEIPSMGQPMMPGQTNEGDVDMSGLLALIGKMGA